MALVGSALCSSKSDVRCIGVAPWGKVFGREALEVAPRSPSPYVATSENTGLGAWLEPNHTEFVLVGGDGGKWGCEIPAMTKLEVALGRQYKCPLILLLIQGGVGALRAVHSAVCGGDGKGECAVVIVEDSGGAASAICHCLDATEMPEGYKLPMDKFEPTDKWLDDPARVQEIREIRDAHKKRKVIGRFSIEQPDADLGASLLQAALKLDPAHPEKQLCLAVQLGLLEQADKLLKSRPIRRGEDERQKSLKDALQLALQLALERGSEKMVDFLLEKGASPETVDFEKLFKEGRSERVRQASIAYIPSAALTNGWGQRECGKDLASAANFHPNANFRGLRSAALQWMPEAVRNDLVHGSDDDFDDLSTLEQPYLALLFFWSVANSLSSVVSMAERARDKSSTALPRQLWRRTTQPIEMALIAARMCRAIALDEAKSTLIEQVADRYEGWAIQVINKAKSSDVARDVLLRREKKESGGVTLFSQNLIEIAVACEAKAFLSSPGVQHVLDRMWNGRFARHGFRQVHAVLGALLPFLPICRTRGSERAHNVEHCSAWDWPYQVFYRTPMVQHITRVSPLGFEQLRPSVRMAA